MLPTYYYIYLNLPLSSLANSHLQLSHHSLVPLIIIIPAAMDRPEILAACQEFLKEKGLSQGKFTYIWSPFSRVCERVVDG
jgi:hypothetical protein